MTSPRLFSTGTVAVTAGQKRVTLTGALVAEINFTDGDDLQVLGNGSRLAIDVLLPDTNQFDLLHEFDGTTDATAEYTIYRNPAGWGSQRKLSADLSEAVRVKVDNVPFTAEQLEQADEAAAEVLEARDQVLPASVSTLAARDQVLPARDQTIGARDVTIAARDVALAGSGPVYADVATGRAAVADGARFNVQGAGDVSVRVYRRDSSSTQTQLYALPSADAVIDVRERAMGIAQVPPQIIGGRPVQPHTLSFDLYVLGGTYLDTGEPYDPLGMSQEELDRLTALSSNVVDVPPILFGGRWLQPYQLSFDLYVTFGQYLDDGEIYAPTLTGAVGDSAAGLITVVGTATELRIFVRGQVSGTTKFLCWVLVNVANAAINSNVWRINGLYEATRSGGLFTLGQRIGKEGEWETAIEITGRIDFMGGTQHGNEEKFRATLLADGIERTLGTVETFTCQKLELFQASHLFEPGTTEPTKFVPKGANVADIYKHWTFSTDGALELESTVEWLAARTVNTGYLAMAPIVRFEDVQVTDTALFSPGWVTQDVTASGFSPIVSTARGVRLWGDTGYAISMEALEGWDKANRRSRVSNSVNYNKIYFDFTGAAYAAALGEIMRARVLYSPSTRN